MGNERRPTDTIQRVGREILRLLRKHPSVSRKEFARATGVSEETVKRALQWLRDQGARISYVEMSRAWVLGERSFALPLAEPTVEDLQATLTAAGLLRALGQDIAAGRAQALFSELAQRVSKAKVESFRSNALRVTQSTAIVREPRWMLDLLRGAGRHVFDLTYRSPWKNEQFTHRFEPWQVWIHDGVLYVRGYSRTRKAPRTFRLATIESILRVPNTRPTTSVPADPWSGGDPRYGVDSDRPGEAVVRFDGPVARWVAATRWHPAQGDVWIKDSLERRLPYRSCRELARLLASVSDGITSIEPVELRDELNALLEKATKRLKQKRG